MAKILCIDDEIDFRLDLVDYLEEQGYAVSQAGDGAEGLATIEADRPDLVICDRTMPKMSGLELLETLREKHPELDALPFIFLTALDDRRDRRAAAYLNPSKYLTKPIDFDELDGVLKALLGAAAGQAA